MDSIFLSTLTLIVQINTNLKNVSFKILFKCINTHAVGKTFVYKVQKYIYTCYFVFTPTHIRSIFAAYNTDFYAIRQNTPIFPHLRRHNFIF